MVKNPCLTSIGMTEEDCNGGLSVEVFYSPDQVDRDVEQTHTHLQGCMSTMSIAYLSTKTCSGLVYFEDISISVL